MNPSFQNIFEKNVSSDIRLTDLPALAGLVLFVDSQDKPVLLLSAANIRQAVRSKFAQQQQKTRRADLKSVTSRIYFKTCPCKFRLALEYHNAIKQIFPETYKDYESIAYPTFIKLDLSTDIPFFSLTRKPTFRSCEKLLGPFPNQKSAQVFLNTLEDVFKLCRKVELARCASKLKSCPYLHIDACCGICTGKVSLDEYRNIINDAFKASVEPAGIIEKLRTEMQAASKNLLFEMAAELKTKLEKLSILNRQAYKWVGSLEDLKIVHIDRSAKVRQPGSRGRKQSIAIFVISFFKIIDLGDFVMDKGLDKISELIEKALLDLKDAISLQNSIPDMLERFAIVSYFLYRSNPPGLWVKVSDSFDVSVLEQFKA